jgi:hypothetical protein
MRATAVTAVFLLALGIPLGLGALGAGGFVLALATTLALSVAVTLVAFLCARGLGMPPGAALKWAARFLSPFEAPRASEELLQLGLDGVPAGRVLKRLLSPQAFLEWLRPLAYDLHHDPARAEPALLTGVDADEMDRALAVADLIDAGATFYCARCGDSFLRGGRCPDCDVALAPVGDGVSQRAP